MVSKELEDAAKSYAIEMYRTTRNELLAENTKDKYRRTACGNYYPVNSELSMLLPHPYQASICW